MINIKTQGYKFIKFAQGGNKRRILLNMVVTSWAPKNAGEENLC
jgi:hypothetical protein